MSRSENIKELVSLTMAKVEILKLKADHYNWNALTDEDTRSKLLKTLDDIDSLIAELGESE